MKRYTAKKLGSYHCSMDCEICEGSGFVVAGMEGFINSRMEQDCRDILEPCENAEFDDGEDEYSDDWREARERRLERQSEEV